MKNSSNSFNQRPFVIYKFSDFYLNPVERKLINGKKQIELHSKTFDILQFLLSRGGEAVSKDEILETVWKDSFVEEGNLPVYISKLRKILGATKSEPFIETVVGVGYRFVARVKAIDEKDWKTLLIEKNDLTKTTLPNYPKRDSIAILPLKNENGNEEIDYLADGLSESLINSLSYIPDIKVIARNTVFRYKNQDINLREVGKELNVNLVLTGRIRVIKDNLIIGVELIKTKDETQVWGTQINQPFTDIFEIQEKISDTITEKFKTNIINDKKNKPIQKATQNPESYRLYLKGKHLLNNKRAINDINKAITYFKKSLSYDPTNSLSILKIANCYRALYLYEQISHDEAKNMISMLLEKVEKLDSPCDEFYIMKGYVTCFLEFNVKSAEKQFQQALN